MVLSLIVPSRSSGDACLGEGRFWPSGYLSVEGSKEEAWLCLVSENEEGANALSQKELAVCSSRRGIAIPLALEECMWPCWYFCNSESGDGTRGLPLGSIAKVIDYAPIQIDLFPDEKA